MTAAPQGVPVGGARASASASASWSPLGAAGRAAPPFVLPGEHFTAALIFLTLGGAGLTLFATEFSRGAYPSLRVIGVTHLFTLGWITTSIMGALYQFLPVALGRAIRSVRLAHLTFLVYVIGLALFITGFLSGRVELLVIGAAGVAVGLILFVGNLAATLAAASRRGVTWWALCGAGVFLTITLVLGATLAGDLRWGYLGANRFVALGVHLHVALGGWVLLVIVGVADHLLPMFLLSHDVSETPTRAAVALLAAGAATLVIFHHGPPVVVRWAPALLMGGGVVCFLGQAARYYRKRVRPSLDPGMRHAALALAVLAVGVVLAVPVVAGVAGPRLATAYGVAVVGGITLFVAALYYKIIPFLVWFHRFGPLAGKQPVPKVAELFDPRVAGVAGALLTFGVIGLGAGILLGEVAVVRAAAAGFGAGVVIEGVQMFTLSLRRPT